MHPACKVHGFKVNFWQNGVDLLLAKVTRVKVIPNVRSIFVGQSRGTYYRDALYSNFYLVAMVEMPYFIFSIVQLSDIGSPFF